LQGAWLALGGKIEVHSRFVFLQKPQMKVLFPSIVLLISALFHWMYYFCDIDVNLCYLFFLLQALHPEFSCSGYLFLQGLLFHRVLSPDYRWLSNQNPTQLPGHKL
jgi:hypothetical protein